jgi:hypothetical protein
MVAGWPAHVAKAPPFCPKGVAIELKREVVEGKGGKDGEGGRSAGHQSLADWPCLASTQYLFSSSISSYSSHAHSIDQKQSQFLSSFSKFLFIYFLDFIICNDEINML